MRCASVFYFVATIVVVVCSLPQLCVFTNYGKEEAHCGRYVMEYTFEFIPPISQNISSIDLRGQPLKQLPYDAFRNLSSQRRISEISVRHCEIGHVDAGALLNLHNLSTINLAFNNIKQIDSKLFSDSKQIKDIYMHCNAIEVLPNGLFQNLLRLEQVYLSHNRIHQVERSAFKNTPLLWIIDLSFNQIEYMDKSFKDKADSHPGLVLNGNPWKCDCELRPFYEFLKEINNLNYFRLKCEKPLKLHGRKWEDMSRDEFVCPGEDATSTRDSVMTSTEPMTTTEVDDNIPVSYYNGTRYRQVDTGIPQPPSNQDWISCTTLVLVLVCVAAIILLRRRSFWRANACNVDTDLPMCDVQSRAMSESGDSALNMADVDEEQT